MRSSASWLIDTHPYQGGDDEHALKIVIDAVCAEGNWMKTSGFEPTLAWVHALAEPDCPRHLLLVACDGERLVGWCRVFPTSRTGEADVGIGLHPLYRNKGLGTRMLQQAVDWAYRRCLNCLKLVVRSDNQRAVHVFKKCGFSSTGYSKEKWLEMEYAVGQNSGEH